MFDVIVVGKGLFGASATRYLSESGASVAAIGPDEPRNPTTHQGVFGAHYDQARITHQLNSDLAWATLTRRSLAQFPALEGQTGLNFYHPVGNVIVVSPGQDAGYLAKVRAVGQNLAIPFTQPDQPTRQSEFPYLNFPSESQMLREPAPSGHFNPRIFLQAQLKLSQQQGATIIPETAVLVKVKGDAVEIITDTNTAYQANKVLIATGAFSNSFALFPRNLDLRLKIEYVVLAEISAAEAERLREMPTVVYLVDSPTLSEIYVMPPVRYREGKFYIKLGANTIGDRYVALLPDICGWYKNGDSEAMLPHLKAGLLDILPALNALSWHTRRCVITRTVHGYPYIDTVTPGKVYVAVGGNGQGAQAADAIGQVAANLVSYDAWRDELAAELFKARYVE